MASVAIAFCPPAADNIPMPITLEQIVEETRYLPADVVARLVDQILVARHGGVERELDSTWKAEVQARLATMEAGQTAGIPVDETLARICKIAGL